MVVDLRFLLTACAVIGYFIGDISPLKLLKKYSNFSRKKYFSIIVSVLNIIKGATAAIVGFLLAGQIGAFTSTLFVFAGTVWPLIYKFKNGGNGVTTVFGATLIIAPIVAAIDFAVVVIATLISKKISVGVLIATILFPAMIALFRPAFLIPSIVIAAVIVERHRGNIIRLVNKNEPDFSFFKKDKTDNQPDEKDDLTHEKRFIVKKGPIVKRYH